MHAEYKTGFSAGRRSLLEEVGPELASLRAELAEVVEALMVIEAGPANEPSSWRLLAKFQMDIARNALAQTRP